MLQRLPLRLLAAALALSPLAAAGVQGQRSTFEGVVTMRGEDDGEAQTLVYYLRGGMMRIELADEDEDDSMTMIADPARQLVYMLTPSEKVYMEWDLSGIADDESEREPQVTKTGRTETIAGHQCEHWIVKDDDSETDICVARGLGSFMLMQPPSGRQRESVLARELRSGDFFPLRVTEVGGGISMEVTAIERKTLDPALFRVPADFKKVEMPGTP